jgi:hypothetical protein
VCAIKYQELVQIGTPLSVANWKLEDANGSKTSHRKHDWKNGMTEISIHSTGTTSTSSTSTVLQYYCTSTTVLTGTTD